MSLKRRLNRIERAINGDGDLMTAAEIASAVEYYSSVYEPNEPGSTPEQFRLMLEHARPGCIQRALAGTPQVLLAC